MVKKMNNKHSIQEKRAKIEILLLISNGINYGKLISQTTSKSHVTISQHLSKLESHKLIKIPDKKCKYNLKRYSLTLKGKRLLEYVSAMDKVNKLYLDVLDE